MGAEKMHEPLITPFFPTSSFLDLMTEQVRSPRPMVDAMTKALAANAKQLAFAQQLGHRI